MADSIFDFTAIANDGKEKKLADYKGSTILIVNTASKCGLTPQYKGLEALYKEYKDRGLMVLGFPCDQFAHQEPLNDEEIASFCERNFGVTFPLMSKINVNGKDAHPIYVFLKKKTKGFLGGNIKWNFTKFLISADGSSVKRYAPTVEPEALRADIEQVLGS
ncbi:glutathione peroxidase [Treponema sp.]